MCRWFLTLLSQFFPWNCGTNNTSCSLVMYLLQINQRIILHSSQAIHCYLIHVKELLLGWIRSIIFSNLLKSLEIKVFNGYNFNCVLHVVVLGVFFSLSFQVSSSLFLKGKKKKKEIPYLKENLKACVQHGISFDFLACHRICCNSSVFCL